MKKLWCLLLLCWSWQAGAAVNVNTADEAQLRTVKGLGEAKARAIVEYRKQNGPFRSLDDLAKVPGFGAKTVDAIRNDLTTGEKSEDKRSDKSSEQAAQPGERKAEARGEKPAERPAR